MLDRSFLSLSLSFLTAVALTPVAGVFWPWPCRRDPPRRERLFCSFLGCAGEDWVPLDDALAGGFWEDLFFSKSLESLSSFLVGRWPQGHQESICRVPDGAWRLALASALTVLSTTSSQESSSRSLTSNWARIEGRRPSRKYRIMVSLLGAATESNSRRTACRCSRCAAQSKTSSCWYWESLLILAQ